MPLKDVGGLVSWYVNPRTVYSVLPSYRLPDENVPGHWIVTEMLYFPNQKSSFDFNGKDLLYGWSTRGQPHLVSVIMCKLTRLWNRQEVLHAFSAAYGFMKAVWRDTAPNLMPPYPSFVSSNARNNNWSNLFDTTLFHIQPWSPVFVEYFRYYACLGDVFPYFQNRIMKQSNITFSAAASLEDIIEASGGVNPVDVVDMHDNKDMARVRRQILDNQRPEDKSLLWAVNLLGGLGCPFKERDTVVKALRVFDKLHHLRGILDVEVMKTLLTCLSIFRKKTHSDNQRHILKDMIDITGAVTEDVSSTRQYGLYFQLMYIPKTEAKKVSEEGRAPKRIKRDSAPEKPGQVVVQEWALGVIMTDTDFKQGLVFIPGRLGKPPQHFNQFAQALASRHDISVPIIDMSHAIPIAQTDSQTGALVAAYILAEYAMPFAPLTLDVDFTHDRLIHNTLLQLYFFVRTHYSRDMGTQAFDPMADGAMPMEKEGDTNGLEEDEFDLTPYNAYQEAAKKAEEEAKAAEEAEAVRVAREAEVARAEAAKSSSSEDDESSEEEDGL
jgi:hypothetical protein